jgi:D-glycero-D-manno-heptose 1,7-bisphosphate phosphatase
MPAKRAAFLDRDGTIIVEKNYLADPQKIEFVDGTFEALRELRAAGFKLVVVTNQSGIARGLYSLADYRSVEKRMEELLREQGIELDGVFFCPHHPDYGFRCDCRKPLLGMYRDAERNLGVDLASSVYVGDRMKDVEPGLQLGGRAILVLTGHGKEESQHAPKTVERAENLLAATQAILGKSRAAP